MKKMNKALEERIGTDVCKLCCKYSKEIYADDFVKEVITLISVSAFKNAPTIGTALEAIHEGIEKALDYFILYQAESLKET